MQQQTYDEASILQRRITDLNQALDILDGNVFDLQEVNLIMTGNNINFRIKVGEEQIQTISEMLQEELQEKQTEFENL